MKLICTCVVCTYLPGTPIVKSSRSDRRAATGCVPTVDLVECLKMSLLRTGYSLVLSYTTTARQAGVPLPWLTGGASASQRAAFYRDERCASSSASRRVQQSGGLSVAACRGSSLHCTSRHGATTKVTQRAGCLQTSVNVGSSERLVVHGEGP